MLSPRYPQEAPLVLITNETLPPGLARKLMEAANEHAARMVGCSKIVLPGWCSNFLVREASLMRYPLVRGPGLER